jgi:hypothetical protein
LNKIKCKCPSPYLGDLCQYDQTSLNVEEIVGKILLTIARYRLVGEESTSDLLSLLSDYQGNLTGIEINNLKQTLSNNT